MYVMFEGGLNEHGLNVSCNLWLQSSARPILQLSARPGVPRLRSKQHPISSSANLLTSGGGRSLGPRLYLLS
ncbi:hypothetical protein DPEC_G00002060 [Dallia pectoralis]|uniref:Uncharacterized protein n=1 Tax=Dallia pectoralis TaxID=75939 RepID=A0ACC2HIX4_DALPE|nr:hypothetical protein DPEC_G00002060 [Dallia pectoralis]